MVLVDTSVWINHFRKRDRHLSQLLNQGRVRCHSLIIGELACGSLRNRSGIIKLLRTLPQCEKVEDDEVLYFIDQHKLMGRGIGIVDAHLLASCHLMHIPVWTADKRLQREAERLKVGYRLQ